MSQFLNHKIFLFGITITSLFLMSGKPRTQINDGIHVKLSNSGFPWLSEVITNNYLNDISSQPLADVDEDMGGGVQGHVEGISYSIDFDHFELIPSDRLLTVKIRMKTVEVKASTLKFKKNSGVTITLKCENVTLLAGADAPINLTMDLAPSVQDGQIRLTEQSTNLQLDESNFSVDGPEHCEGRLGVGSLIRQSVHSILDRSKSKMITAAQNRIRDLVPKMEESLNKLLSTSIPIAIGGTSAIPLRQVLIQGRPKKIDVSSDGLTTALDVDVLQTAKNLFGKQAQRKTTPTPFSQNILASVALKTELINQLLDALIPKLPTSQPIDTSSSPSNQIFSKSSLASILPDLNQLTLDDDTLSAHIGFGKAPRIATRTLLDGSINLTLEIPDLHILLSIRQGGKEIPYFDLMMNAAFGLHLNHDPASQIVELSPQKPGSVQVAGHWAPGYVPKTDIFEQDVALLIFSSAVEYLMTAHPMFWMKAPSIALDPSHALNIAFPFATIESIGVALEGK